MAELIKRTDIFPLVRLSLIHIYAEVLEQNSYYRKAWADYRAARSITYSVKGGQDDDK